MSHSRRQRWRICPLDIIYVLMEDLFASVSFCVYHLDILKCCFEQSMESQCCVYSLVPFYSVPFWDLFYSTLFFGYIPTPLTVNKMVCFYFYHPGGAPRFSWFSCVFLFGGISGAFLCVPACFFWYGFPVFFVVFFLVSFGDFAGGMFCAFPGAFFTVFWCFFPCIFSCLSLFFSIYVSPWWWSCFSPCFFRGFWVFFPCFFSCFLWCFFLCLLSCFFSCIFSFFFSHFFRVFFFRALGGTQDKQPQYFAFWPVLFSVLFLVVTTSEDRIYTSYSMREQTFLKVFPNSKEPIRFYSSCSHPENSRESLWFDEA